MADGVLLLLFAVMVTGSVFATRAFLRLLRRRRDRRMWQELVARHLELDHKLEKIWQRR